MQLSHNQRKYIRRLQDNQFRDMEQCFSVEGEKLCQELLRSTFEVEYFVVRTPTESHIDRLADEITHENIPIFTTDERGFKQISDTTSPQGILAVVRYPHYPTSLSGPLIILDSISDPGNVGTIIRTADWFGFNSILLCGNSAHRFHPKTVRATMGSVFRSNILHTYDTSTYIREHLADYTLYGASLSATKRLQDLRPTNNQYALVFGSESHGISPALQLFLTDEYIIPTHGEAESLNVAVAAGISLFHFANMG